MKRLHGKTAFVSGGSRGIGRAIAERLAIEGANVMISGSRQVNVDKAVAGIAARPDIAGDQQIHGHADDLRKMSGCEAAFAAHQATFGTCDIFVHSAGATKGGAFPAQSDADYQDGFALKFHAAVRLSRLFWPSLVTTHGNVVMIVGGAARTPDHKFMVGGAVNAALANYTKALAGQGLEDDVNVNWVSPGQTESERLQELMETRAKDENKSVDEVRAERMQHEGIRRLGQPNDVAALVAFLCGDEARHIHGTGISVDGGATKGCF
jgi:NAD(P)-dependent dehydrogenase (short-subunit alcohol dehydrogenase family)